MRFHLLRQHLKQLRLLHYLRTQQLYLDQTFPSIW